MGGSKSPGHTYSQTSQTPWTGQQPYLTQLYKQSQGLYGTPLQYYPGQTVAGVAPEQEAAWQATSGMYGTPMDPLTQQSADYTRRVMGGEFMEGNPYLDQMYERAAQGMTGQFEQSVLPQLEARFAGAGRTGSPAYGQALGLAGEKLAGGLGDLASQMYGGAYETERGRMGQAAQFAPQFGAQEYARRWQEIGALGGVGQERRQYEQDLIADLISRWEFAQSEPWERLGMFQTGIGGPWGGTTSMYGRTTQPTAGGGVGGFLSQLI